jgi:pimeloyl-ACP methyl ester carboxylesterase
MDRTAYRTVDVNGLSVFYREAGPPDAPTILLLHGFPSSSRMWQPLLDRLAVPDAEVHVLDAGHFALDERPDLIADLTRSFLQRRRE